MAESLLETFREIGSVAEQTRVLLQRVQSLGLEMAQRDQLDRSLAHLATVREGFQLSLRSDSAALSELQAIVRHTLAAEWSFLEELGLVMQEVWKAEVPDAQLMTFSHASIALSLLPLLPPSEVSHPTSSHYRDLPRPRRPGEWLERIEELEALLTRLQMGMPRAPTSPSLRRAHAYFDTSAWLVRTHLERFGRD